MYKDEILQDVSTYGNVAQFISFDPFLNLRFQHTADNISSEDLSDLITSILEQSSEKRVNVRSFLPDQPKGNPFDYGKQNADEVIAILKQRAEQGLYTIINETIDTHDGGVSGVVLGDIIEFTPNDTPKGVDKPGACSLPRTLGIRLLEIIYGFKPLLDFPPDLRVEFSIHPVRRGVKKEHTIIWEIEKFDHFHTEAQIAWPNNFSSHIGDKAFGLLIAHLSGFNVPHTTVISRTVAPFSFGSDTGLHEVWIRTAPVKRTPGKFSTFFGWVDPFKLLVEEDPEQKLIASVLSQKAVDAKYSGSLLTLESGRAYIEGVEGKGDEFMVGHKAVIALPDHVIYEVEEVFQKALKLFGPLELEWVYDGNKVWIVQLHKSHEVSINNRTIVPGSPNIYLSFHVNEGLEKLRSLIANVKDTNQGIRLIGQVGITSHFGDILRKAEIPSYIE